MSASSLPTIETIRLILRPMESSDLDDLLLSFADPEVMASSDSAPFNREQMVLWLQRYLDHQAKHRYGLFAVVLKSDGVLIGDCGLEVLEVDGLRVAELGYDFRSDYWSQGFATEAATAVRDFALNVLGLPELISLIRVKNVASQRVAEKIGMIRISEFRRNNTQYRKFALTKEQYFQTIGRS